MPKEESKQVLLFIILLCCVCGLLLATAAFALQSAQTAAKEFDQQKQLLLAAKVIQGTENDEEIKAIAKARIRPLLTDKEGQVFTFEEKKMELEEYLTANKKTGVAHLPEKLFYAILPKEAKNDSPKNMLKEVEAVVIPIAGFGLWGPIYGFLALEKDGDTVIGTTWYEHAETPGLGANITAPWWQNQFLHKVIFQESVQGNVDLKSAPIGIIVVKGKVRDVYGNLPKAKSAVDGISGATLTGDGVTAAYRTSLTPYRNFFIRLNEAK